MHYMKVCVCSGVLRQGPETIAHPPLPEVRSQIDGWSKRLVCDNGRADASGLHWNGGGVAVLDDQVDFVLEQHRVVQVGG